MSLIVHARFISEARCEMSLDPEIYLSLFDPKATSVSLNFRPCLQQPPSPFFVVTFVFLHHISSQKGEKLGTLMYAFSYPTTI
jgi:hypothetical protein